MMSNFVIHCYNVTLHWQHCWVTTAGWVSGSLVLSLYLVLILPGHGRSGTVRVMSGRHYRAVMNTGIMHHSFIHYLCNFEILKSFKINLQSLYIQHYFDIGVSIRSIIGQFLRHDRTWYIDCIISSRAVTSNTIIGRASSSIQSGKSRCKYQ